MEEDCADTCRSVLSLLFHCEGFKKKVHRVYKNQEFLVLGEVFQALELFEARNVVQIEGVLRVIMKIKSCGAYSYVSMLSLVLELCHIDIVDNAKLKCPEMCPYHGVFTSKFIVKTTCNCGLPEKIQIIDSFIYDITMSSLPMCPCDADMPKRSGYISAFVGKAFNQYKVSLSCQNLYCKSVPQLKISTENAQEILLLNLKHNSYPSMIESLRYFAMFPFTLDSTFDHPKTLYLQGYLITSSTSIGSFCKSGNSWTLQLSGPPLKGPFMTLLSNLLLKDYFPILFIYTFTASSQSFTAAEFQSLQAKLFSLKLTQRPISIPDFGPMEPYKNIWVKWVCQCKTVNQNNTCQACGQKKAEDLGWVCVCGELCETSMCICGKAIPECSRCKNEYSCYSFSCVRCEGDIVKNICEVCGFNVQHNLCFQCYQSYWRCEVCYFGNLGSNMCKNCFNPNDKLVTFDFLELPDIAFNSFK